MKDGSFWILAKQIAALRNKITLTCPDLPRLVIDWEIILGSDISNLCRPKALKRHSKKGTVLLVSVTSNSASLLLSYKKHFILEKIQCYMGNNSISEISFIRDESSIH